MYKLTYLFFGILLISLASASLGTFQQDTCVNIRTILNTTQANVSSISFPNETVLYLDEEMTVNGKSFNYSFCNTDLIGTYIYDYYDLEGNVYVNDFDITYNGKVLTEAMATIYSVLLGICVLLWFMILFYITRLPGGNERDDDGMMSINKLKYLRSVFMAVLYILSWSILFLASNVAIAYLPTNMFGEFLFTLYLVMGWLMIPMVFLWILWIFHTIVTDKKLRRFMERGGDFGGKGI